MHAHETLLNPQSTDEDAASEGHGNDAQGAIETAVVFAEEDPRAFIELVEELPDTSITPDLGSRLRSALVKKEDRREAVKQIAGAGVLATLGLGIFKRRAAAWSYNPATYTTPICCRCYPVTQWYGTGSHMYGENAKAIDIGTPSRTPVYAPKDGVIAFEGWEGVGGIVCRINHSDGLQSILAHLSQTVVDAGWWVRGSYTLIGYSGATGNVTGPHLHWALKIQGTSTGINLDNIPGVSRWQICP